MGGGLSGSDSIPCAHFFFNTEEVYDSVLYNQQIQSPYSCNIWDNYLNSMSLLYFEDIASVFFSVSFCIFLVYGANILDQRAGSFILVYLVLKNKNGYIKI